jgi:hypothetical protein
MAGHIHARHALLRIGLGVAPGWWLLAPGHDRQPENRNQKEDSLSHGKSPPTFSIFINPVAAWLFLQHFRGYLGLQK